MSILKDLHIINPFNENDFLLVKDYCLKNNLDLDQELQTIKENYTEIQYKHQQDVNIINKKIFYTKKDDTISNFIYVELEKDTKTANVYPQIHNHIKNLLPELTDYLILNNNMEEVFVFLKSDDLKTITNLLEEGFISLSTTEDKGQYIPFLKEKEKEEERNCIWRY